MTLRAPGEITQIIWWVVLGISLIVLVLRYWLTSRDGRGPLRHRFTLPDALMTLTWCSAVVMVVLMTLLEETVKGMLDCAYKLGNGFDIIEAARCFTADAESWFLKIGYWAYLSEIFEVGCTKATLYSVYFIAYSRLRKRLQIALICGAVFAAVTWLLAMSAHVFWCGWDLRKNWYVNPDKPYDQVCVALSAGPLFIGYTVFTIVNDIILIGLGWSILAFLQVKGRRELVAAGFVFLIGIFSIVAAVVRFGLLYGHFGNFLYGDTADRFATWISLQALGAFISCLLPTLRAFLRMLPQRMPGVFKSSKWGSWMSTSRSGGTSSGGGVMDGRRAAPDDYDNVLLRQGTELQPV